MAVEDFTLVQKRGKTIYMIIRDLSNDTVWDSDDNTFKALAGAVAPFLSMPATSVFGTHFATYLLNQQLSDVHDAGLKQFYVAAHIQLGASPDPAVDKPAGYRNIDIAEGMIAVVSAVTSQGVGDIQVDQDYGGQGRLCYRIQGIPVDNAEITFFLLSDFNAGNTSTDFIVASTRTRVDGAWVQSVMLDPADYALVFHKQGEAGPDSFALGVTDDPALSTLERISPPPPQATITDDCVIEGLDAFGGNGTILVDQDFGGPNALTWELDGNPVTGAEILVFLAADYNSGKRQNSDSVAASRQLATGDWQQAVKLDPGQYILQFFKKDVAGPDVFTITVA